VRGMVAYAEVPVSHACMLVAPSVAQRVCAFLHHGTFAGRAMPAQPVTSRPCQRSEGA